MIVFVFVKAPASWRGLFFVIKTPQRYGEKQRRNTSQNWNTDLTDYAD
jgi:hypothetical protein